MKKRVKSKLNQIKGGRQSKIDRLFNEVKFKKRVQVPYEKGDLVLMTEEEYDLLVNQKQILQDMIEETLNKLGNN